MTWLKHSLTGFFVTLSFANMAYASVCDFDTTKYRDELLDIRNVKSIDIKVNKYRKWTLNQLRILKDPSRNIEKKYKKNFKSKAVVDYDFGRCELQAKVRQNGDWRDHIKLVNGNVLQSLDVTLKDGNIAGIVRFKLLLPETRNGDAEIFTTAILHRFPLLVPRTRYVTTSVNEGDRRYYLFQENAEKEFLEYNSRREGPILEGHEDHLWRARAKGEAGPLDLVAIRMSNSKWAAAGQSSAIISANALSKLNLVYTEPYYRLPKEELILEHNGYLKVNDYRPLSNGSEKLFVQNILYDKLLWLLGAEHGLIKHNRKFYWNSSEGGFEPIYYDGNPNIDKPIDLDAYIKDAKTTETIKRVLTEIDPKEMLSDLKALGMRMTEKSLSAALEKLLKRLNDADADVTGVAQTLAPPITDFEPDQYDAMVAKDHPGFLTSSIRSVQKNDGTFLAKGMICNGEECRNVLWGVDAFKDLIRGQHIVSERYVLPPTGIFEMPQSAYAASEIKLTDKSVFAKHSSGVQISTNAARGTVNIELGSVHDWVLFDDQEIADVVINIQAVGEGFDGQVDASAQRFNEYGITGCLNFYRTDLTGVEIHAKNMHCEDAVNFVNVTGDIRQLSVDTTFSDAVDADFSHLYFDRLEISNAGNDCLDFSYGNYNVAYAKLSSCGDKAVSVGEHSELDIEFAEINKAAYGFVSKDSSKLTMHKASQSAVAILCAGYNKKTEFYGATIVDVSGFCKNGKTEFDHLSKVVSGASQ